MLAVGIRIVAGRWGGHDLYFDRREGGAGQDGGHLRSQLGMGSEQVHERLEDGKHFRVHHEVEALVVGRDLRADGSCPSG